MWGGLGRSTGAGGGVARCRSRPLKVTLYLAVSDAVFGAVTLEVGCVIEYY